MESSSSLPKKFFDSTPWSDSSDNIWLGSVFILHRNLSPFPFPGKMNPAEKEQTFSTCASSILPILNQGKVLKSNDLTPHIKDFLFEHFILSEGFEHFDEGQGMLIDESGCFLGLINVEDHVHIHLFEKSQNWDAAYARLSDVDNQIGRSMEFAFSSRFGHLTSDPLVCGTGLVVQTFLHLPALIHTGRFSEVTDKINKNVIIRGLGQEDEFIADLVLIENKFKLGVTEPDILKSVHKVTSEIAEEEKKCREELKGKPSEEMKDFISRAFGILKHARTLQIEETLTSLSLFELGKSLGWIAGGQTIEFKKSFFTTRRAHLQESLSLEGPVSKFDLILKRASLLQKELNSAKLEF